MKKKLTKQQKIRRRRLRMIKRVIGLILTLVITTVGSIMFLDLFLDAWAHEIDTHAEYNRNYYRETHMYKDEIYRKINGLDEIKK